MISNKRLLLVAVMFAHILSGVAQTETITVSDNDSLHFSVERMTEPIMPDLVPNTDLGNPRPFAGNTDNMDPSILPYRLENPLRSPVTVPLPNFGLWKGGSLNVSSYSSEMPGLAMAKAGKLTLSQNLGDVRLSLAAQAYKQWTPSMGGIYSMYGIGGTASWQLSDYITLYTFGEYCPSFMGGYTAGGYVDIRFNEHWGAELGAYYSYSTFTHHRSFDPIVTPYYRFNDGSKLYIPVGPFVKYGLKEFIKAIR